MWAAGKVRLQTGPGVRYLWLPNSLGLPAPSLGSSPLPLSSVSGLRLLGEIWDDLPSSEYEQTPKHLGDPSWKEKCCNHVWQDLDGRRKAPSGAEKTRRGEILEKQELNELEVGSIT